MLGKKAFLLIFILAISAVVFRISGLDGSWFTEQGLHSLGPLAPYAFVVAYTLAVVLAVPGGPMTALAGALFGTFWGVVTVSIGSTTGACIAFLIARYVAKERVSSWLSSKPAFSKMDKMIAQRGWIMIAIVRLIPLFPFNIINYGMGLTSIPFRQYAAISWLCMLPGTVVYVAGGDVIFKAIRGGGVPWRIVALIIAVGLALIALSWTIKGRFLDKR